MGQNRADLTGRTLGTSVLEKLIGQGGMGAVYLARQTRPARHVAVKVLMSNFAIHSQVYQEFLTRFRREADLVARLEHVNIMPIYEYGEQDGLVYLVMPYLSGGSLRDLLAKGGALPMPTVISYMQQAAAALDYAHAQGIIHRDLKPANFLLHADGRLVLADFGIARIIEDNAPGSTLTGTGAFLGTPEYMAPEMARGEQVDHRADIYELGIVLFQMLSGHVPFSGSTPFAIMTQHVQQPLPLLHQSNPAIPPGVDNVIQKATAKDPTQRYTTAQAMVQDLQSASTYPASTHTGYTQDNIPTVLSSAFQSVQQDLRAYHTPAPQSMQHASTPVHQPATYAHPASNAGYLSATPSTNGAQTAPYATQPPIATPNKQQPLLLLIGLLLALVLVIGGVLVGLQINRGGTAITNQPGTTPTVQHATTPAASNTATPSLPTSGPTSVPTPSGSPITVTTGPLLYTSTSPGQNCDANKNTWLDYNGIKITCQGSNSIITNTAATATLQGTFLVNLPGKSYPANYVVQVQLQQNTTPSTDFGIYFRNQPGNQQGVYTFLLHPNGTWSAYVYDNQTGAPTILISGAFAYTHAPVTLAVAANGSQFTFYANGRTLATINDSRYTAGTAGIVVDQGGTVTASNFALYAIA